MSKEFILNPRGKLENADLNIYKEVTGRDLTVRELRLLPYIQNCFANEKLMNGNNLNQEEKDLLKEMNNVGLIKFGRAKGCVGFYFIEINEPLWNVIVKTLYDTYVAKSSIEPQSGAKTCKELTGSSFSVNKTTFNKIHYAVLNGGSIIESELNKKERELINKLEKMDLIYFERRSPESERFNIGTSKVLWDVINEEMFNSLKVEEENVL